MFVVPLKRSFTIFLFCVLFLLLTISCLARERVHAGLIAIPEEENLLFPRVQESVAPVSVSAEPSASHTLVGSYYSLDGGMKATLMLNNKGITPLEVQPTLFSADGQQLIIPTVFVEPRSARYIDLEDWAVMGGPAFRSGSIRLFHYGRDLILGAQIYLTDETHRLTFEEKLAEVGKFDSRRLEAVWFQPANETRIIISNTSDQPLTISGRLTKAPRHTGDINTFI